MTINNLNVRELTQEELIETEGGIVIALAICCFAAGVAIGLMLV